MNTRPVRFDLKKAKIRRARAGDTEITSFSVREVNGQDEELAANLAKGKGGAATAAEEMIRLSIATVNDEAVQQPYLAFDLWNSRARAFALKAFNDVNGMTVQEGDDFLGTAEDSDAPLSSVPVGASANG